MFPLGRFSWPLFVSCDFVQHLSKATRCLKNHPVFPLDNVCTKSWIHFILRRVVVHPLLTTLYNVILTIMTKFCTYIRTLIYKTEFRVFSLVYRPFSIYA
uniref:Uncharacterized protein n=1 Tax=Cacopsylla melanoneura TaxID=428564 RepID=A0A8D8LL00_9HEMI